MSKRSPVDVIREAAGMGHNVPAAEAIGIIDDLRFRLDDCQLAYSGACSERDRVASLVASSRKKIERLTADLGRCQTQVLRYQAALLRIAERLP